MHRVVFTIVFLVAQNSAFATTSFWVSVGSFQDSTVAERVLNEASGALPEHFVLLRADTPNGVFQRVVSGPYASHESALTAQDHAKSGGYSDSWVFTTTADATLPAAPAETSSENAARSLLDNSGDVDYRGGLDSKDNDLPVESPIPRSAIDEPQLPTEVPEGYRLNSLYRDSVGTTPAN